MVADENVTRGVRRRWWEEMELPDDWKEEESGGGRFRQAESS